VTTAFSQIAAVLLAAGRGERFGENKLAARLGDRAVVDHAASALAGLPFAWHIAVVPQGATPLRGFACVSPASAEPVHSQSLACGVAAAKEFGASAVLICLGDMPLVPENHIRALVAGFDGDRIVSTANGRAMPPALFGAQHFDALLALQGDRGASALLGGALAVALPVNAEIDIDTPEDLALARAIIGRP